MKKILKFVFSRIFIVSFFIVIETFLIISSIVYIEKVFPLYPYLIYLVNTIIILIILSKDEEATYKIPWIIIILILPLFGWILYILFKESRMNNVFKKRYNRMPIINKTNIEVDNEYSFLNYIERASSYPCYYDEKSEYLRNGEDFFEKLIKDIKEAEKYIFLEFFIIKEGHMLNRLIKELTKKKDLDIRIIYDDFASSNYLKKETIKQLKKMNIKIYPFNKYNPILSTTHNNRDHRKIVIIDGTISYCGGINIADEYINISSPFGKWQDSAVRIKGKATNSFIYMYIKMWNAVTKDSDDYKKYVTINESKKSDNFVIPFSDGPRPYYKNDLSQNIIINLLYHAKKEICITTPYLVINSSLLNAIKNASNRGVDIKIIFPFIPDKKITNLITKSFYNKLIKQNVKIYEFLPGFIHSKEIIIDGKIVLTGTINLDYRSLIHNFECGVLFLNESIALKMKYNFLALLKKSKEIKYTKENIIKKMIITVISLFAPLL